MQVECEQTMPALLACAMDIAENCRCDQIWGRNLLVLVSSLDVTIVSVFAFPLSNLRAARTRTIRRVMDEVHRILST